MKKAGKQTPTPKSEPFKKFTKKDSSSDEMDSSSSNSFDEDFEVGLIIIPFVKRFPILLKSSSN